MSSNTEQPREAPKQPVKVCGCGTKLWTTKAVKHHKCAWKAKKPTT